MRSIKAFIRALLYSNIFISICAVAFVLQGYFLLHIEHRFNLVALLGGLATLFTYMLIRIVAVSRIRGYEPDGRWKFFLKNIFLMRMITVISFLGCMMIYFLLQRSVQIALLIPGFISVAYGIPLTIKSKAFRLRDVGIAKIFMISFVWAYVGAILPWVDTGGKIFAIIPAVLFLANFLFIFGITLPFDIKDQKIDAMNDVKTIPLLIGSENTYSLSFLCLFASGATHLYLQRYIFIENPDYSIPISISILIAGLTVYLTSKKNEKFVYFGLLDGMIILQFLLIYFYSER
ncbi:MAG: hypothetical protein ACHQFW_02140 [Chitinophagales bacterium]